MTPDRDNSDALGDNGYDANNHFSSWLHSLKYPKRLSDVRIQSLSGVGRTDVDTVITSGRAMPMGRA